LGFGVLKLVLLELGRNLDRVFSALISPLMDSMLKEVLKKQSNSQGFFKVPFAKD